MGIFREYARTIALIRSIFSQKCSKYRSADGIYPDPLGELTTLPQTHGRNQWGPGVRTPKIWTDPPSFCVTF